MFLNRDDVTDESSDVEIKDKSRWLVAAAATEKSSAGNVTPKRALLLRSKKSRRVGSGWTHQTFKTADKQEDSAPTVQRTEDAPGPLVRPRFTPVYEFTAYMYMCCTRLHQIDANIQGGLQFIHI